MFLVTCSEEEGIEKHTETDANFTVPLRFRLSGSPNGKPDLQLQLLCLDFGAHARGSTVNKRQGSRKLLTERTAHGEEPDPETFVLTIVNSAMLFVCTGGVFKGCMPSHACTTWNRPLLYMMCPSNKACVYVGLMCSTRALLACRRCQELGVGSCHPVPAAHIPRKGSPPGEAPGLDGSRVHGCSRSRIPHP